jgi:hypothetical protein
MKDFLDDKDLVILAVTAIALYAMFCYPAATSINIILPVISGLFGIAVGRKLQ